MSNTLSIPIAQFRQQAVFSNFPNELYEAVSVTTDLQAWAKAVLPDAQARADEAKTVERGVFDAAQNETSWRFMRGPKVTIKADHAAHIARLLAQLANGKNASSWDGLIDRAAWPVIVAPMAGEFDRSTK